MALGALVHLTGAERSAGHRGVTTGAGQFLHVADGTPRSGCRAGATQVECARVTATPGHRARLPRRPAPGRSRSPTGVAPPTRTCSASRTPSPRSGTRRPSATPTWRPTSTPPATGCCWPSTTTVLDRVSDTSGGIEDATYAEIRRVRIGGRGADPDARRSSSTHSPTSGSTSTSSPRRRCPLLAALIEEREAHDRVLVGSFSLRRLNRFRRLTGGRVPTSATPLEVVAFRFLPSGRLADRLAGAGSPRCRSRTGAAADRHHRRSGPPRAPGG